MHFSIHNLPLLQVEKFPNINENYAILAFLLNENLIPKFNSNTSYMNLTFLLQVSHIM